MKLNRLCIIYVAIFFTATFIHPQQFSFYSLNGPYGGSLGDIVFTSTGEIFVSAYYSDSQGVFKSTNSGNNWQHHIPDTSMPWLDYFAMGVNHNDEVFAGTNGGGIYKSADNGETWNRLVGYPKPECWAIAFNDSGHIFAGDGDNGGVFKSIDNGATWSQILPNSAAPLAIEINEEGIIFIGTRDNFYRSTDNGNQWVSCYQGLNNQIVSSILAYSNSDIYVGTGYYNSGNGVYHSSDLGNTWEHKGLNGMIIYSLTTDQFGDIYVATKSGGIYKSDNQGLTWQTINKGLKNFDIFRIKMTPENLIFACSETEGGIYKSIDYGESWLLVGMVAGTMWQGLITESGNIYAATDGGVQKYDSSSGNWSAFGLNEVKSIIIDKDGVLFAGTRWDGVYASYDDGNTWNLTSSIGGMGTELFTMTLYPDNTILLGTNNYIKISTDKGTSWITIINQLPSSIIGNLVIGKDQKVYVTSGTNLCMADDLESDFFIIKNNISSPDRNGIAVGNYGLLFLTDSFFDPGILRSTDYGVNWSKISNRPASSIAVFDDKYIVSGHGNGEIMFSSNNGESWSTISQELPPNSIIFWSQIDSSGHLYCAASGFGLFKSNSVVTGIGELEVSEINSFILEQNYPNPFNPVTRIQYQVSGISLVVLKVFDLLGNEIATLVDEYKPTGKYEIEYDANGLSSGIYFYQLRAGDFIDTRKMSVIK